MWEFVAQGQQLRWESAYSRGPPAAREFRVWGFGFATLKVVPLGLGRQHSRLLALLDFQKFLMDGASQALNPQRETLNP